MVREDMFCFPGWTWHQLWPIFICAKRFAEHIHKVVICTYGGFTGHGVWKAFTSADTHITTIKCLRCSVHWLEWNLPLRKWCQPPIHIKGMGEGGGGKSHWLKWTVNKQQFSAQQALEEGVTFLPKNMLDFHTQQDSVQEYGQPAQNSCCNWGMLVMNEKDIC